MKKEFQDMSESDIEEIISKANMALEKRQKVRRSEVISEIRKLAASIGISVTFDGSEKQRKVPPKYRHPEDPTKQWSGRGMKPAWVRDLLNSGKKLDELKIAG